MSTSHSLSCICSQCVADSVVNAPVSMLESAAYTRPTLSSGERAEEISLSKPKATSSPETAPSYPLSDLRIRALISDSCSLPIIGAPKPTSSGTPSGQRKTDSVGTSVKPSLSLGLPTTDKERKAIPVWTYLTQYFPDATLAEVAVSVAGNEQHNPGQPLHWAREKSKDQLNTAARHMWDHSRGVTKDTDGQYHLAKAIWRLKAELQLTIEKERDGAN